MFIYFDVRKEERLGISIPDRWAGCFGNNIRNASCFFRFPRARSRTSVLWFPLNTWGTSPEVSQWDWFCIRELLGVWLQPILDLITHGKYYFPIAVLVYIDPNESALWLFVSSFPLTLLLCTVLLSSPRWDMDFLWIFKVSSLVMDISSWILLFANSLILHC